MNKDYVSWGILGGAAGVGLIVYLAVIGPVRSGNRKLIEDKRFLAARLVPVTVDDKPEGSPRKLTEGIRQLASGRKPNRRKMNTKEVEALQKNLLGIEPDVPKEEIAIEDIERAKVQDWDKKLYGLYPLTRNLKNLPTPGLQKAKRAEDTALSKARGDFVRKHFVIRSFKVDPGRDFKPPPPAHIGLFREWVREEDKRVDAAFAKAGEGIDFLPLEDRVNLFTAGQPLHWLKDGRVTGWIDEGKPQDRTKVLHRLVLRRQILMALARAKVSVRRLDPVKNAEGVMVRGPDGKVREREVIEPRGVDKIISLAFQEPKKFLGAAAAKAGRVPYVPHRVELKVSCHLAVVPALLRELEAIGMARNQEGKLVQKRAFCFWAEHLKVTRVAGWPAAAVGSGELNPERAARHGRYLEWPVKVTLTGVIPEFNEKLDPAPRRKK